MGVSEREPLNGVNIHRREVRSYAGATLVAPIRNLLCDETTGDAAMWAVAVVAACQVF